MNLLNIVSIIVSIILGIGGIIVGISLSAPFREFQAKRRKHITWKRFFACLTAPSVLNRINKPENRPDIIIGVNSGIVPASILALNLDIMDLYFLFAPVEYDREEGERQSPKIQIQDLDLTGKRVLIVDDQTLTGITMNAVYSHLKTMKGARAENIIRFAVFAYESSVSRIPLDIPAPGKIKGEIERVPWMFLERAEEGWSGRKPWLDTWKPTKLR